MTKYLSAAETAKLIRKELKVNFPGVTFYVRSDTHAGGASIDIYWMDGPTGKQVDVVTNIFSGAEFDGMIDLKVYNTHWMLPDGTVQLAHTPGTDGCLREASYGKPHPDAEEVHLGADFIFTHRKESPELTARFAAKFHQETGWAVPETATGTFYVKDSEKGDTGWFKEDYTQLVPGSHETIAREYNRGLWQYTEYTK
jgi:hypothetical protein